MVHEAKLKVVMLALFSFPLTVRATPRALALLLATLFLAGLRLGEARLFVPQLCSSLGVFLSQGLLDGLLGTLSSTPCHNREILSVLLLPSMLLDLRSLR